MFPNENFAGRFSLIGKDKDDEKFLLPALVGGADCFSPADSGNGDRHVRVRA